MAGSTLGTIFKITTWGESHGPALGVVIDGCPAGLDLAASDIQKYLDRRKPGQSSITTPRKESDTVEILSGVFEGRTTGTPISLLVRNTSQISRDYSEIASFYRPGHADYTFDEKYGFRDYRGGGRSSGRETIGRVAAGAIACLILGKMGVHVQAYTRSIGPVSIDERRFDASAILETPTAMPDRTADAEAMAYLEKVRQDTDSSGGCMECIVTGLPAGIGDPVFEKLDACLAKAIVHRSGQSGGNRGRMPGIFPPGQRKQRWLLQPGRQGGQSHQPRRRYFGRDQRRQSTGDPGPREAHSLHF